MIRIIAFRLVVILRYAVGLVIGVRRRDPAPIVVDDRPVPIRVRRSYTYRSLN